MTQQSIPSLDDNEAQERIFYPPQTHKYTELNFVKTDEFENKKIQVPK